MWAYAFTFKHFNSPNGPIRFCLPQPIFCRWEPWPLMYGAMGFMPGLWKVVDIWTFKSNSRDTENWAPMPTCVVMNFGLSSPTSHAVINLGLLYPFYHLCTCLGPIIFFFKKYEDLWTKRRKTCSLTKFWSFLGFKQIWPIISYFMIIFVVIGPTCMDYPIKTCHDICKRKNENSLNTPL